MSPSGTTRAPLEHAFLAPKFESATVLDAMRVGVVSCTADTSLREAARMMATYRIHCIVVFELEGGSWGVASDLDLVAAAGEDVDRRKVGEVARTKVVTIRAEESATRAAQLMTEEQVAHLVVVQPGDGHPVGILSTLDLAGVLAWGGS